MAENFNVPKLISRALLPRYVSRSGLLPCLSVGFGVLFFDGETYSGAGGLRNRLIINDKQVLARIKFGQMTITNTPQHSNIVRSS